MRFSVLLTLMLATTGCHQMSAWNPQGRFCGQSILSSCTPRSSCETPSRPREPCADQVVAPFGPCGQRYRVVPGRSHRALTMAWSSLPVPVPKFETFEVPPQLEPVACATPGTCRPPEPCSQTCAPQCARNSLPQSGLPPSQSPPQMSEETAARQEAIRRLLAELKATQAHGEKYGRTEQLQQQTRELESRVDELLQTLEAQNQAASSYDVPDLAPLPTISSQPPLPQIIEQTGGYRRSMRPGQHRTQPEMWQHSPQNPTRGL